MSTLPALVAPQLPTVEAMASMQLYAENTLNAVNALVVDSPEGELAAADWLTSITSSRKDVEAVRTAISLPVDRWLKGYNAHFKPTTVLYDKALKVTEGKLGTYRAGVREERDRAQRELQEAERLRQEAQAAVLDTFGSAEGPGETAGDEEAALALVEEARTAVAATPEVAKTLHSSIGFVASRMVWKHEVVTPDAVPRAYCIPDEALLREAVAAGVRTIPGVRIFEEERFSKRTW